MYVDDILIFTKANTNFLIVIKTILDVLFYKILRAIGQHYKELWHILYG